MSNDKVLSVRIDKLPRDTGDRVSFVMTNALYARRYHYFIDIPVSLESGELAVRLRGMADKIEEDIRFGKYEQQASEF